MSKPDYYTVRQLAAELNVTKQRVHQLIEFYGVRCDVDDLSGWLLVSKVEAAKIPRERPPGVHVG